jgi:hypothetical protein
MQRAVEAARADAAIRQASLAALLADLRPALGSAALPAELKAAIRQLLALGLSTDAPIDAAALRAAVARSGLFLEPRLAQSPGAPPDDMKAALLMLQQALLAAGMAPARRPPKAPTAPPSRGGPLAAQGPRAASVTAEDAPERLLAVLGDETEQALARQTLHQIASLPDGAGARWSFELPLATPHGAAVAQFAIERDGHGGAGAEAKASWRVRFALDMPPLGPVHAHLRLHDGRSDATLWAERPESAPWLQLHAAELAAALRGDVAVHAGAPPAPPAPPPGQLLDRTT